MIKGFDDAVIGMKNGEEKTIRILPKEAYGEHKAEMRWSPPRDRLPPGEPKKA